MSAPTTKRSSSFDQSEVRQKQQRTHPICEPCRARVTRCDRQRPCSSCILANTQNQCYPDAATYQRPPSHEVSISPTRRRSQSYRALGAPMGRRGSDGQQLYEGSTAVVTTLVPLTDDSPELSLAPVLPRLPRRRSKRRDNNLDILSRLPPGDVCEQVVDYYFEHCNWLYKYFDRRAFSDRFQLWRTEEDTDSLTIAGIAIICAIVVHCLPPHHELAKTLEVFPNYEPLPAGASARDIQSAREKAHADTSVNLANEVGARLYDTCQIALDREKAEDKVHVWTMDFMEVVLGKCHYLGLSKIDTEELWSLRGELLTMATALGLHRYPASEVSDHVAQRHRWLWANIVFLERWQALMHGRPLSILPEHFDVEPPSPDAIPLPTCHLERNPTVPSGLDQSDNLDPAPKTSMSESVDKDVSMQRLLALSLDPDVPLADPSEEARALKAALPSSSSAIDAAVPGHTLPSKSPGSLPSVLDSESSTLEPRTLSGSEEGGTRTYEAHIAHFNLAYILGRIVDDVLRLSPVVYSRTQSHDDDLQRLIDELAPSLNLTAEQIADKLVSQYTGLRRQGVQALVIQMATLHVRFMLHRPYASGEVEAEPPTPAYQLLASVVSQGNQRQSEVMAYLRAQEEKDHRKQVRLRADEHATSLAKAVEAAVGLIDLSVVTVPKMTHANACAEHAHLNWAPVQVTGAALFLIYVVVTSPTPRSEDDADMRPSSPQAISASSSASSNATRPYPSLNALRLLPTIRRALQFLRDISFISTALNSASLLTLLEPLFSETFVLSSKEERIKVKKETLLGVQRLSAPYKDGGTVGIVGGQQTPPSPISPVDGFDTSAPAIDSNASVGVYDALPRSTAGSAPEPQMPPPLPKDQSAKPPTATRPRPKLDTAPRKRSSISSADIPASSTSQAPPASNAPKPPPTRRVSTSPSALKRAPRASSSALPPSTSHTKRVSFEDDGFDMPPPPPPPGPSKSAPPTGVNTLSAGLPPFPPPSRTPHTASAPPGSVPPTLLNAPSAGPAMQPTANVAPPTTSFPTDFPMNFPPAPPPPPPGNNNNNSSTPLPGNPITPFSLYGHTDLWELFGGHPRGAPPTPMPVLPAAQFALPAPAPAQTAPPAPAPGAPAAQAQPQQVPQGLPVIHHALWPPPPPPRSNAMFNSVFPGLGAQAGQAAGAQQQQQQQPLFGMGWSGAEQRGVFGDLGLGADLFGAGAGQAQAQTQGQAGGAPPPPTSIDDLFGMGGFSGSNM